MLMEVAYLKDVLVTGAYGGMGRAIVKALCERGYRVLALDKDTDEPQENVIPIKADITSPEQISAAYHCATQHTNTLFAIVHLAGVYMLDSLAEMSNHDFDRIISINLRGAFLINKTFLPLMKSGGRIIMVTSELATVDPCPLRVFTQSPKARLINTPILLLWSFSLKAYEYRCFARAQSAPICSESPPPLLIASAKIPSCTPVTQIDLKK